MKRARENSFEIVVWGTYVCDKGKSGRYAFYVYVNQSGTTVTPSLYEIGVFVFNVAISTLSPTAYILTIAEKQKKDTLEFIITR